MISQEMIQVTRHIDVPQRKAPSRSIPTMFQMTTPPLSAPNASVAQKSCSSQGSLAARPAQSEAHLSRSTCTATSCCQVARCIHVRRVSCTIAQLHQYALLWALQISWLCPEHDLKLFTCFCVSPCRKNSSDKNSEGQPVFRAVHLCNVHHSLHMNGSIWYGLEDLSCIPSLLPSRCGSQVESTLNPTPPRLSTGNAYEQSARPCFNGSASA